MGFFTITLHTYYDIWHYLATSANWAFPPKHCQFNREPGDKNNQRRPVGTLFPVIFGGHIPAFRGLQYDIPTFFGDMAI